MKVVFKRHKATARRVALHFKELVQLMLERMNLFMLLQAQRELKSVCTKSNRDSLLNLKTNESLQKWTEKNRKTEKGILKSS